MSYGETNFFFDHTVCGVGGKKSFLGNYHIFYDWLVFIELRSKYHFLCKCLIIPSSHKPLVSLADNWFIMLYIGIYPVLDKRLLDPPPLMKLLDIYNGTHWTLVLKQNMLMNCCF